MITINRYHSPKTIEAVNYINNAIRHGENLDTAINDAANIFSDSYESYNELSDELNIIFGI